jgi:hypothetical protein
MHVVVPCETDSVEGLPQAAKNVSPPLLCGIALCDFPALLKVRKAEVATY